MSHRHSSVTKEALRPVVYDIVGQIPAGRVLTYGAIAALAGWPNHSRLVGHIMRTAPEAALPCHRVVSADGSPSERFASQRRQLEAEGVTFTSGGKVSLRQHLWRP